MKQLTKAVSRLTAAVGARCFWVGVAPERVAIIDPGMTPRLNRVARELRRAGRSPYEVTDILLTHGDSDHAQVAAEWQRRTGARVFLGTADAAILAGEADPSSGFRQVTRKIGAAELPRNLTELDQDLEIAPGLVALKTAGHTPGHFAFRFENVLFAGDAARCQDRQLVAMPALLDDDRAKSAASLARLQALDVDWYCCGHSDPAKRVIA